MMHGMFRSNGGCGYFKKPHLLMSKSANTEVFDPKLPWPVRMTLKVNDTKFFTLYIFFGYLQALLSPGSSAYEVLVEFKIMIF